jgi:hypothetical protein
MRTSAPGINGNYDQTPVHHRFASNPMSGQFSSIRANYFEHLSKELPELKHFQGWCIRAGAKAQND